MSIQIQTSKFKIKSCGFYIFSFFILHFSFFGVAFAAEEVAHSVEWKEWLWKILNFAILVFILVKFIGKPLKSFLKRRTELIEKTLAEAREAKEFARKALADVEERLKFKDREIEDIINQSRRSADMEQKLLIQQGEQMREKILEQARDSIDYEMRLAKEAIKAEAVEVAMELAEKKLKERLKGEDHIRLIEESLKRIEGKN
ncbi:MAG: F0F1 ATP synthase subunit B [Thermodesulfovibrionales bacterium]